MHTRLNSTPLSLVRGRGVVGVYMGGGKGGFEGEMDGRGLRLEWDKGKGISIRWQGPLPESLIGDWSRQGMHLRYPVQTTVVLNWQK